MWIPSLVGEVRPQKEDTAAVFISFEGRKSRVTFHPTNYLFFFVYKLEFLVVFHLEKKSFLDFLKV